MGSDADSFDPRTWMAPAVTPPPSPVTPQGRPGATAPAQRQDSAGAGRTSAAALAGSAAILMLGAVAAFLSRPGTPPAPPTAFADPRPGAPTAAEGPATSRRTLVLSGPAALNAALHSSGIDPAAADAAGRAALGALGGSGEIHVVLTLTPDGQRQRLDRLEASFVDSSGAVVSRAADGTYRASKVAASLTTAVKVVRGEMDAESFYSSAVAAGIADTLVPDIAKALAFDFDFQREIHPGDVFEIAWEQEVNAQGQAVGTPRLRYVSMTTTEKSRSLYWFKGKDDEGGWYDGNGTSVVRSLMRTPVDGARVTSNFGFRTHPIYGFMKMHKGVDFAAPIGTPIYASGNGVVEVASPSQSAGNWLKLRHDNGWLTVYMHMNRYMPGIVVGARLHQGQQIGEVGTTGHSTGPHLHYEVHVNDEPVDPLSIKTDTTKALDGAARAAFIAERDRIDVNRARQSS